jgi:hypothetical protein
MTPEETRTRILPAVLVGLGLFFLARNFGLLTPFGISGDAAGFVMFAAGGAAFLYVFNRNREHWWALIPAFALFGLAAATLGGPASGSRFLGLLGLGFASVYLVNRQHWWALIPGGVLLTLSTVAWLDAFVPGAGGGWVFFLGIALTFGILTVLPERQGRQSWAVFPTLGALAFVVLTFVSSTLGNALVPIALIVAGAFLYLKQRDGTALATPDQTRDHDEGTKKAV